jgi:chemotaxis protein CheZ
VKLVAQEMAEPRKVFRIEQSVAARPVGGGTQASAQYTEIMQALAALRGIIGAQPSPAAKAVSIARDDSQWLGIEAEHLTRIAHELEAVTAGTDQATQKILAAAEQIDQLANDLGAALKGKIEQGSAQDISDLVIRIFEACNFQDLIGQRVTKVMATLKIIEAHIACLLDEIRNPPPAQQHGHSADYLHGPRLDIDRGHVSQRDIDAMFGG